MADFELQKSSPTSPGLSGHPGTGVAAYGTSVGPAARPATTSITIQMSGRAIKGEMRVTSRQLPGQVMVEGFDVEFAASRDREFFEALRNRWWQLFRELEREYRSDDRAEPPLERFE